MGQNQWHHFGVGAPPISVYFSFVWDVRWRYDLDFDPQPDAHELTLGFGPNLEVLHLAYLLSWIPALEVGVSIF